GRFVRHAGLASLPPGDYFGVAVGDYDRDGYPDVYLSALSGGRLLHNEGGRRFRDVTQAAGVAEPGRWSSAVTWADLDRDGLLDLVVGHYVRYEVERRVLCQRHGIEFECPQSFPPDVPAAYRNLGDGRFADMTATWGLDRSGGRTLGIVTADLDGDGQVELVLANDMAPGDLFVRQGEAFENQGVASGTAYSRGRLRSGMGVDVGDFDRDGRLDIVEMSFAWQGASLLRNIQGLLYRDVAFPTGVGEGTRRYVGFGSLFVDLDNDGWLDLFITNGQVYKNAEQLFPGTTFAEPSVLLYNHRGRYVDLSDRLVGRAREPIVGRGLAAGDYDRDGRLDLLVVDQMGQVQLLRNETHPVGHWLSVRLRDRAGVDVQGAQVWITIGSERRVAVAHNDGSYVSASEPRVHLGLGTARGVDELSVRWPSGRWERFGPLPADRRVDLREGEGQGGEP
ncbi:MAG: CRTAC1 family protein, partial [Myxococcota bacterium]|nr:CRTAC1 family protein [Myxococcota bacterium]